MSVRDESPLRDGKEDGRLDRAKFEVDVRVFRGVDVDMIATAAIACLKKFILILD